MTLALSRPDSKHRLRLPLASSLRSTIDDTDVGDVGDGEDINHIFTDDDGEDEVLSDCSSHHHQPQPRQASPALTSPSPPLFHPPPLASALSPKPFNLSPSVSLRATSLPSRPKPPPPVPIPHLTKKSRGRRVPTSEPTSPASSSSLASSGKPSTRNYVCQAKDCGKRFSRGEHLKRHVRSIHTNEKPFKCPQPDCGKFFSRFDNLTQHQKVHKRTYSRPRSS